MKIEKDFVFLSNSQKDNLIYLGRLLCSGSSMFLKKRFGKGYSLTLDLKFKIPHKVKIIGKNDKKRFFDLLMYMIFFFTEETKQFRDINTFILQEMPDATLREHIGSEITYSFKYENRNKFERLFKQLEINKERLAIGNYGISDTTLEEVC